MSETMEKVIWILAGLVVAVIAIGWGNGLFRSNIDTAGEVSQDMEMTNQAMLESSFTQYDATEITGSQLINLIKKYEQEGTKISVVVNNGRAENTYVYTEDLSAPASIRAKDAKDRADLSTYINPSTLFLGEVVRDADTNTITGLKFTKVTT